ncbi:hypothetical protein Sste5346_003843 [Sporothrix stenoceras]|uniref:Uncharacterized protein n=1 Tax=Sporothrix stenoceras TaxID=5173 RepID=A0ABR3ZCV7_9PEZI
MSAQLWDMSNTITITRNDSNSVLEGVTFPQSSSQSMASSGITTGTHDSTQGNTHSGGQSPAGSTHDLYFPMDALFAVSRNFIQTIQIACHGQKDDSGPTSGNGVGTTNMEGASSDRVDAESFIVLADSTYAALLDVYQRVFHLVEVTANNERPTLSSHNGNNNGSNHFMRASKGDLKHSARFASGPSSSWKDSAALSCLRVCRFPDVSVGGFPIVSTPALQLGLGLRLADDFLSHFSSVVVTMHNCFPPARRGENVAVSAPAEQQQQQQQHPLPTVSTNCLPHPPLVISEDLFAIDGFGAPMDWDASTATSVSSSSGTSSLFSLQYGLGMHRSPSSMDDIVLREHDLRQELAGLRNKLAV